MAQPNIFQRYVENLLKSYDIVEVGQFLSDQNILSEKELNILKTRLQKKEIIRFLTQLLDGDSSRLELFRKAIMKFAMDTMYQTINQLSDWSPSQTCLLSSEKSRSYNTDRLVPSQTCLLSSEKSRSYNTDRLVNGHPDTTVLFSDHDAETLTHNPVTTDQYSQVVQCTISQETGYDTEHPPLSQSGDTPRPKQKHPTKYGKSQASRLPTLERSSSNRKEDLKHDKSAVKITSNYIHVVPPGLPTIREVRRTTRGVCLSFHPKSTKGVCNPTPQAQYALQESNSMESRVKCFRELLQETSYELLSSLNVDSLLPHLQKERLLTHEEFEALIHPLKTGLEKKNILLSILPSKGEHAYDRFLTCLTNSDDHSGHSYLVKLLTSIIPSKSVSYV